MRLKGKTALVTGCNRGIGKAIIEKFAKDGANLITVTRTNSKEFEDFTKFLEDTYQIDGEPYFGYMRGRYTKEELKDVVSYCNSIQIQSDGSAIIALTDESGSIYSVKVETDGTFNDPILVYYYSEMYYW